MSEPRRVRPGEIPRFGQIWSWQPNGPKYLVLGLEEVPASWGSRFTLVGLQLLASPNTINRHLNWTANAHVGMGPVLDDWFCHDEGDMGHPGRHHGAGTPDCPSEMHHHHDEKCPW